MARFKRGGRKLGRGRKRKRTFKRGGRKFNKRVKLAINKFAEKKYIDSNPLFSNAVSTGVTFVQMGFVPIQGTSVNTRIGDQIYRRSLTITGQLFGDSPYTQFRVVIFAWNQQIAGNPTTNDLFAMTTNPLISLYRRDTLQQKRMIIMFDKHYTMNSGGASSYMRRVRYRFSGKRLPWKKLTLTAGAADKVYYMAIMSDHIVASPATANFVARMTYTDV